MEDAPIAVRSCPSCSKDFGRGFAGFGPSRLRCPKCGREFASGLADWDSLGRTARWHGAVLEIFAPTVLSAEPAYSMLGNFLLFVATSLLPLDHALDRVEATSGLAAAAALARGLAWAALYPATLALRLVDRIRRSTALSRSGRVPLCRWWLTVARWRLPGRW